MAGLR